MNDVLVELFKKITFLSYPHTRHSLYVIPRVQVISCGQLPTPGNGRKSTFAFTPGTKVQFDCDPGYVLVGERRRWCYDSGDWNWPELGTAECIPEAQYNTMQVRQIRLHILHSVRHINITKPKCNGMSGLMEDGVDIHYRIIILFSIKSYGTIP